MMPLARDAAKRASTLRDVAFGAGCPDRAGQRMHPRQLQRRLGLDFLKINTMETVNIDEAETRLSQSVDKAAAGEDVVLSRYGKPVRVTASIWEVAIKHLLPGSRWTRSRRWLPSTPAALKNWCRLIDSSGKRAARGLDQLVCAN
jgi:antitoxin (DNA-binding transcriptional repressor) of toxin-antitoxin stability system